MVLPLEINGAPFSAEGLKSTKLVRHQRIRSHTYHFFANTCVERFDINHQPPSTFLGDCEDGDTTHVSRLASTHKRSGGSRGGKIYRLVYRYT